MTQLQKARMEIQINRQKTTARNLWDALMDNDPEFKAGWDKYIRGINESLPETNRTVNFSERIEFITNQTKNK